jgi:hypothetical protein
MTCAVGGTPRCALNPNRRTAGTSKPAASRVATVSRFGWQPPAHRVHSGATRSSAMAAGTVLGSHMLVEPELPAWPQDPAYLSQRGRRVRHGAHHQRQHHRIAAGALDREGVGGAIADLDRDRRAPCHGSGPFAQRRLRFDRDDSGDSARVAGEVQARPGADLADDPGQVGEQLVAVCGDTTDLGLGGHPQVRLREPLIGSERLSHGQPLPGARRRPIPGSRPRGVPPYSRGGAAPSRRRRRTRSTGRDSTRRGRGPLAPPAADG